MINANFIAVRLYRTCDIIGGEDNLLKSGFHNIMGYLQIVKDLNIMSTEQVLGVLVDLYNKEGIYRHFAEHVLNGGVLQSSFFPVDENFNETDKNLRKMFNERVGGAFYNDSSVDVDSLNKRMEEENEKLRELYEKNSKIIKNASLESLRNESLKKEYESSGSNFEDAFKKNIDSFKNKINPEIYNWIINNVPNLSDEDYGMLMSLIYKTRNDGK
jgi:hypothetical protein